MRKPLGVLLLSTVILSLGCTGMLDNPNSNKAISSFSIADPAISGIISEDIHSIALTVPYGTDVTKLVPIIMHNGASLRPISGAAQDFTSPVIYTVTAFDGSLQEYTVYVTVTVRGSLKIRSYSDYYTDPSIISPSSVMNAILDVTLPDSTTTTVVTDDLGYYDFGSCTSGDYIIQPRYSPESAAKTFTVSDGTAVTGDVPIPQAGVYFYVFNSEAAPVNNLALRQALCKAINRQEIINAYGSIKTLALSLVPAIMEGAWSTSINEMSESVDAANTILAGASPIAIELLYNTTTAYPQTAVATVVETNWEGLVGSGATPLITVGLLDEPWADYAEIRDVTHTFQVVRSGWILDSNNLLGLFDFIWLSINNGTNAAYLSLLEEVRADFYARDFVAYEEGLVQLNNYLIDNALVLPMFYY